LKIVVFFFFFEGFDTRILMIFEQRVSELLMICLSFDVDVWAPAKPVVAVSTQRQSLLEHLLFYMFVQFLLQNIL
jgi:hypothetical protein